VVCNKNLLFVSIIIYKKKIEGAELHL